jgi:hypothetical protein
MMRTLSVFLFFAILYFYTPGQLYVITTTNNYKISWGVKDVYCNLFASSVSTLSVGVLIVIVMCSYFDLDLEIWEPYMFLWTVSKVDRTDKQITVYIFHPWTNFVVISGSDCMQLSKCIEM